MLRAARPTKLPHRTTLQVGMAGRLYPAWIERWTRHVFAAAGPVAKSVPVILYTDRLRLLQAQHLLRVKLERWGYLNIIIQKGRKS